LTPHRSDLQAAGTAGPHGRTAHTCFICFLPVSRCDVSYALKHDTSRNKTHGSLVAGSTPASGYDTGRPHEMQAYQFLVSSVGSNSREVTKPAPGPYIGSVSNIAPLHGHFNIVLRSTPTASLEAVRVNCCLCFVLRACFTSSLLQVSNHRRHLRPDSPDGLSDHPAPRMQGRGCSRRSVSSCSSLPWANAGSHWIQNTAVFFRIPVHFTVWRHVFMTSKAWLKSRWVRASAGTSPSHLSSCEVCSLMRPVWRRVRG
jgi:hypothetical protein